MKKLLIISLFGILALTSAAKAATDSEIAGYTPDSRLYFLDQIGEWLDMKLTFNAVRRAEKKLEHADERMAEMKVLGDDGKLDKEKAEKIKADYEDLSDDASSDIDDLKAQGQDVAELVKKMEELSAEHTAKMMEVLDKVPEAAKDAIEHALEMSKKGHERAIEALLKEVEEGNIDEEELDEDTKTDMRGSKEKRSGAKVEELDDSDLEEVSDVLKDLNDDALKDMGDEIDAL